MKPLDDRVEAGAARVECDPKYTPGPWRIDEGRSIMATWDTGEDVQIASMSRSRWDSASSDGRNERLTEESIGNARLIAAAPDLLEAAQALLFDMALHALGGEQLSKDNEHVVAMRAAISKATRAGGTLA